MTSSNLASTAKRSSLIPSIRSVEVDWNNQIPKRGDQRQMETWQRIGTYTAGLALQDAGIKDDEALCASMDMVVAAGGGERDVTVDKQILAEARVRNDLGTMLNEKLTTELRPTLFLAQLSNLLAGNISIVHKVTGSSRTFMGEEGCGYLGDRYRGCSHSLGTEHTCACWWSVQFRTSRYAAGLRIEWHAENGWLGASLATGSQLPAAALLPALAVRFSFWKVRITRKSAAHARTLQSRVCTAHKSAAAAMI